MSPTVRGPVWVKEFLIWNFFRVHCSCIARSLHANMYVFFMSLCFGKLKFTMQNGQIYLVSLLHMTLKIEEINLFQFFNTCAVVYQQILEKTSLGESASSKNRGNQAVHLNIWKCGALEHAKYGLERYYNRIGEKNHKNRGFGLPQ